MGYWKESDFERDASEVARWVIYVARNKDAPGKGGALFEVRADSHILPEGDFYRIRFRRIATLNVIGEFHISLKRNLWSQNHSGQLMPWKNWDAAFQVTVNHVENEMRFGPTGQLGNLQGEDKGLGVGRYCLAKVIRWAVERYPEYKVATGSLSSVDARCEAQRDRRNTLYEGAGFLVDYSGDNKKSGTFYSPRVADLSSRWRRSKVREVSLYGLIGVLARCTEEKRSCAGKLKNCYKLEEQLKAENDRLVRRCRILSFCLFLTIAAIMVI
ncbi:MAG: hypothetical protein U0998_00455 [Moraxellaceae bacterium]|nr:hypothetical protein [Paludibacter sp.]MDZ4298816.1 hypothetical protein [Moraxellaceae bacterium]MDZ4385671.1 hypothetical protein [Moraxellaceae bacterium]